MLLEEGNSFEDNRVGALPVIQDGAVVGIITETNIFDAFIDLLGFRDSGTRISVEVEDSPGILANVANVIKGFGANITHLRVYRVKQEKVILSYE